MDLRADKLVVYKQHTTDEPNSRFCVPSVRMKHFEVLIQSREADSKELRMAIQLTFFFSDKKAK